MLKYNIKLFLRNIKKSRVSFIINIIGLSTGLACAILIFLWVNDELNMNRSLAKDGRLYQVLENRQSTEGIKTWQYTSDPMARTLKDELPEVESATAINAFTHGFKGNGVISNGERHIKVKGMFATPGFFDVFPYPLAAGSKDEALLDRNGIIISETLADKLFGDSENVVGSTLEWNHSFFEGSFYITAVFGDVPSNTTKRFDVIFSYGIILERDRYAGQWNSRYAETYLVLKEGTDVEEFNDKMTKLVRSKHPSTNKGTFFLQQFSRKYLYGKFENGVQDGGRIEYVRLLSIFAVSILLLACINFMNLSTARASKKMREIGVKKAIGANRRTLVVQFLGESILMAFLSLIVAALWVALLLPRFSEITGKTLFMNVGLEALAVIVGIVFFTGIVSGSYPAFYLSGFNPVLALRGKQGRASFKQRIRNGLVILQFAISVVFIIGFLVIDRQVGFTMTRNLGYDRDYVISFQREGRHDYDPEVFLSELRKLPGVVTVASMPGSILDGTDNQSGYSWRGLESDREYVFKAPRVGYGVIETLGMEMLMGRSFSKGRNDDNSKIMLNESAVKMMGLKDPIGRTIWYGDGEQEIIGVVKDFQYGSIRNKIEPLVLRFRGSGDGKNVMVKIKAGAEKATISKIEGLYKEFHPRYTFQYSLLDSDYQALYASENRVSVLSQYFTLVAIMISSLGLFGLAAFTTEQRKKEIGIRKVHGQSVLQVVTMLSGEFVRLVLISIVISAPVAYLLSTSWLSGFAYRIELKSWYFLGAGAMALTVALLTVVGQTLLAANKNPVNVLREE